MLSHIEKIKGKSIYYDFSPGSRGRGFEGGTGGGGGGVLVNGNGPRDGPGHGDGFGGGTGGANGGVLNRGSSGVIILEFI